MVWHKIVVTIYHGISAFLLLGDINFDIHFFFYHEPIRLYIHIFIMSLLGDIKFDIHPFFIMNHNQQEKQIPIEF